MTKSMHQKIRCRMHFSDYTSSLLLVMLSKKHTKYCTVMIHYDNVCLQLSGLRELSAREVPETVYVVVTLMCSGSLHLQSDSYEMSRSIRNTAS